MGAVHAALTILHQGTVMRMPRPEIQGLKYFPFDVGFFRDKKIRLLRGEHGADGVEVYQRLTCKCYEDNGYFLVWDNDEDYDLLADETGYSNDKIRLIISSCLRRSLFDNTLFEVGNVLTSRGIQRRYFSAIRDTKVKAAAGGRYTTIYEDLCLLTDEDILELNKSCVWLKIAQKYSYSGINDNKSTNNPDKSPNNPANETKGNETILNENIDSASCDASLSDSGVKPVKHSRGQYGWVRLTDAEYERLVTEFGIDVTIHYITIVDESAQQTSNKNKWKDWNLTVRKAIRGKWGSNTYSNTQQSTPKREKTFSEIIAERTGRAGNA